MKSVIKIFCAFIPSSKIRKKARLYLYEQAEKYQFLLMRFTKRIIGLCLIKFKRLYKTEIVVYVDGGIGSQFFQFLLGQIIRNKTKKTVRYDIQWYTRAGLDVDKKVRRIFELPKILTKDCFEVADKKEACFFRRWFFQYRYSEGCIDIKRLKIKPPDYMGDYYCIDYSDYEMIKEDIVGKIDFSGLKFSDTNLKIFDDIKSTNSVAVHIRRGDFVKLGWALSASYYINAINYAFDKFKEEKEDNIVLYFFSNDMHWVKENIASKLGEKIEMIFVENNDSDNGIFDMYLISSCKHQILSNSNFGFMATYLKKRSGFIFAPPPQLKNLQATLPDSCIRLTQNGIPVAQK